MAYVTTEEKQMGRMIDMHGERFSKRKEVHGDIVSSMLGEGNTSFSRRDPRGDES